MPVPNYLLEAYMGFYDDDSLVNVNEKNIRKLIAEHTPEERLSVYLVWNGIIGRSEQVYTIATTQEYAA